jgi:hypothetical protein
LTAAMLRYRYDANGHVVASKGMVMKYPWEVFESQKYLGRSSSNVF